MSLVWTPHPLEPAPTKEQILAARTPEQMKALAAWHDAREKRIEQAERDPLNHGYEFETWAEADFLFEDQNQVFIFGGNGSSKSAYGARTVVRAAVENPRSMIYCFAQDQDTSVRIQQRYIHQYLPPELRQNFKTDSAYAKYSQKNGFTGESLILPNGSEIYFHTYSQFISNRAKFEGLEVGSRDPRWYNIGFWFDEYLESGDLYETMLYRIPRRDAKILVTFTPIDGFTPFVAKQIKGSRVVKTRPTSRQVFPNEGEPQSVEAMRVNDQLGVGMVYFESEQNPWAGFDSMVKTHGHKSVGERLTRFYGVPVKSMTSLFPLFSTDVNVISSKKFPNVMGPQFTRYQVIDPANARNYFALWAAVNAAGEIYIYREWPDRPSYGEWAIFGDPKWKKGPASDKLGYNVKSYVDLFHELEGEDEEIFERLVDSRFAASAGSDGADLFQDFEEHGFFVQPTDGQTEEKGLTRLDDWFSYNPNLPVDSANKPLCYIHEKCGNLIESLLSYAADGKKDEALKDPIDALRYLRMANEGEGIEHYDSNSFVTVRKSQGGY